ncbi:unnamed protein product, partial [Didymodactylos carnosus]
MDENGQPLKRIDSYLVKMLTFWYIELIPELEWETVTDKNDARSVGPYLMGFIDFVIKAFKSHYVSSYWNRNRSTSTNNLLR